MQTLLLLNPAQEIKAMKVQTQTLLFQTLLKK